MVSYHLYNIAINIMFADHQKDNAYPSIQLIQFEGKTFTLCTKTGYMPLLVLLSMVLSISLFFLVKSEVAEHCPPELNTACSKSVLCIGHVLVFANMEVGGNQFCSVFPQGQSSLALKEDFSGILIHTCPTSPFVDEG